jgi:hypothetical protein
MVSELEKLSMALEVVNQMSDNEYRVEIYGGWAFLTYRDNPMGLFGHLATVEIKSTDFCGEVLGFIRRNEDEIRKEKENKKRVSSFGLQEAKEMIDQVFEYAKEERKIQAIKYVREYLEEFVK